VAYLAPTHEHEREVSPRRARALLEAALDEIGWPWCRSISLWLDELVIRQERDEAA
jgi:hypothetical protein